MPYGPGRGGGSCLGREGGGFIRGEKKNVNVCTIFVLLNENKIKNCSQKKKKYSKQGKKCLPHWQIFFLDIRIFGKN